MFNAVCLFGSRPTGLVATQSIRIQTLGSNMPLGVKAWFDSWSFLDGSRLALRLVTLRVQWSWRTYHIPRHLAFSLAVNKTPILDIVIHMSLPPSSLYPSLHLQKREVAAPIGPATCGHVLASSAHILVALRAWPINGPAVTPLGSEINSSMCLAVSAPRGPQSTSIARLGRTHVH